MWARARLTAWTSAGCAGFTVAARALGPVAMTGPFLGAVAPRRGAPAPSFWVAVALRPPAPGRPAGILAGGSLAKRLLDTAHDEHVALVAGGAG